MNKLKIQSHIFASNQILSFFYLAHIGYFVALTKIADFLRAGVHVSFLALVLSMGTKIIIFNFGNQIRLQSYLQVS